MQTPTYKTALIVGAGRGIERFAGAGCLPAKKST